MAGSSSNSSDNSSNLGICVADNLGNDTIDDEEDDDVADYDWSQDQRADLLGCYYFGYVTTQIVGAWLSSKFGFKYILLFTTLITSIITIFTPFLADAGYGWIFAARIILGFFHGVTFPLLQGNDIFIDNTQEENWKLTLDPFHGQGLALAPK